MRFLLTLYLRHVFKISMNIYDSFLGKALEDTHSWSSVRSLIPVMPKYYATCCTIKLYYPEDRFLKSVISVISVVLRKATRNISVSTSERVSMESEVVTVVSLYTTEISEITRFKIRSSGSGYLKQDFNYKFVDVVLPSLTLYHTNPTFNDLR